MTFSRTFTSAVGAGLALADCVGAGAADAGADAGEGAGTALEASATFAEEAGGSWAYASRAAQRSNHATTSVSTTFERW